MSKRASKAKDTKPHGFGGHPKPRGLGGLESALGHEFENSDLLVQALTHSSASPERKNSNERLEFLGDRVLGLAIAGLLMETFADENEGKLGYRFSALARSESLARVATDVGLGAHIILSESEEDSGGRENANILADCCEAVIAALYLDGGLETAATFIHRHWKPLMAEDPVPPKDAKTMLQEWAQAQGLPLPSYSVTNEDGPSHAPVFTVEAALHQKKPASAQGPSKQAAEQAAAEVLLKRVQEAPEEAARPGVSPDNKKSGETATGTQKQESGK